MRRVNMTNVLLHPLDPPGLCVSIVHDIVDVSLIHNILANLHESVQQVYFKGRRGVVAYHCVLLSPHHLVSEKPSSCRRSEEALATAEEFPPVAADFFQDEAGFARLVWLEPESYALSDALFDVG